MTAVFAGVELELELVEPDREVITEADVLDPVAETGWLELEAERLDWEYGRAPSCIHWGAYPPPRQRPEP